MLAKAAAIALTLGAALADRSGAHTAAFYLLLGAIPAAAIAALASLGDLVERGTPRVSSLIQTLLGALVVGLVVVAAAARASAVTSGHVPRVGASALVGCLVLYALQGLVGAIAGLHQDRGRRTHEPARADRPLRRAA
jgi:hypothetical protein